MATASTLLWFRRDLRLHDNPAVRAAVARGGTVLPVFIWAPEEEEPWAPGAASRWWLHRSLESLSSALSERGARLVIRRGPSGRVLRELAVETGAGAVLLNRCYEPRVAERDAAVVKELKSSGVTVQTYHEALLFEPRAVRKPDGAPYQVFTAFWKTCCRLSEPPKPRPAPAQIPGARGTVASVPVGELDLTPTVPWDTGLREAWTPGEQGALRAWRRFMRGAAADYERGRDIPGMIGTSRMFPYLHFGEVSVRRLWYGVKRRLARKPGVQERTSYQTYLRELGWREFAYHLLSHFPRTPDDPLNRRFSRFPWKHDTRGLRAWQQDRTGYPIVDAGMRELWAVGWMHNRVRMIVASFLVKDQLLSWKHGARWFWDTLVDADLANNTLGWQWSAGCGADAAPYFRIFNPINQGKKFDPQGVYVRRWVPEIAGLPDRWLHAPWEAPASVLAEAGVALGRTYPHPIVDHGEARRRALEAFSEIRRR